MKVFRELSWFFKQERKSYLKGILLLFFVAILQLIPPRIIGIITDDISKGTLTIKDTHYWVSILIACGSMMYVFRYYWRVYIFGSAVKLSKLLRNQLFEHFTNMSPHFYQQKRIGDLMAHATNDVSAVEDTAGVGILTLVDSFFTGGFVINAMIITIDLRLTIVSLLPMPIIAVATTYLGTKLHQRFQLAQEAFSSLNDKTQESISGIKVIKTFGQEKEDIEDFRELFDDVVKKNIAVAKIDALYDPMITAVVALCFFLSIGLGAKLVLDGSLTIGKLVSFNTYLGLLIWPMLAFGWMFNILERGSASYERIEKLLSEKADIEDLPCAIDKIPSGEISFHLNHFAYPGESNTNLQDIYFTLGQGETLGIVGKTGASKTTLIKLLIREFEGYQGSITIGKIPIQEYRLSSFRKGFGYVPQDQFLFSASIYDNIAFAKPKASEDEVLSAAKIAHIHEDILGFSDGYHTMVGERGVSLSGGQKQRISIARALLLDPEILILDDALSAVDAKTEGQILKDLRKNRKNKTTFILTHRLSAVSHADIIIVLENGRIAERGTHEQLMEKGGWYCKMYEHQQLESLVNMGG